MSGRKVFVSSDMSVDERLLQVSKQNGLASLLWLWLLTALNDWGRCEAAPLWLKASVWPMNDAVSVELISEALDLFAEVELIECYSVDGRDYLRVPEARWWKWQTHIHREKREVDRSRIPALESESTRESTPATATPRDRADSRGLARDFVPSPSPSPTPSLTDEQGRLGERERAQAQGSPGMKAADAARALVAPAPPSPASQPSTTAPPNVTPLPVAKASARPTSMTTTTTTTTAMTAGSARAPDLVWDACIATMGQNGAAPSNRVERGRWAKGIQALKESLVADGSPPSEIVTRARRYRTRFGPSVPLNPMALAGNWTTLATDIPQAQEGPRHGYSGQSRCASAGNGAYGRSSGAGGRHGESYGRSGRPQVGTPEYYEQAEARALAERHARAGGGASEGQRNAVVG